MDMSAPAPTPVKPSVPERLYNGQPPGNGHGNGNGHGGDHKPQEPAWRRARRNSIWPFLLDLGVVMALFGLIIAGRPLIAIGGVLAIVSLAGWIREARAEYARLED
jgi:hypothetical protein